MSSLAVLSCINTGNSLLSNKSCYLLSSATKYIGNTSAPMGHPKTKIDLDLKFECGQRRWVTNYATEPTNEAVSIILILKNIQVFRSPTLFFLVRENLLVKVGGVAYLINGVVWALQTCYFFAAFSFLIDRTSLQNAGDPGRSRNYLSVTYWKVGVSVFLVSKNPCFWKKKKILGTKMYCSLPPWNRPQLLF